MSVITNTMPSEPADGGSGGGGGTGTVTTVGSADGSVIVTNPTTTPDLSARVLSAATPGALAAINVNTNPSTVKTGSMAFVTSNGFVYTLQPKPTGVAADGSYVVATADDASRIWIKNGLLSSPQNFVSNEIDFMTSAPVTWGPNWPVIGATKAPILVVVRPLITAIGGTTFSANAGVKFGTNGAAFDNLFTTPNFLVFGSLNGMLANGVTKNAMPPALVQGGNNDALTGLDVAPTVTPTAATGVGTTLKAKIVLSMIITDMAP